MATTKNATSTSTKALEMLKKSQSVSERAEAFISGIQRDIKDERITVLERKIEKLKEKEFELSDFALETDANRGTRRMTQDDCKNRFAELMDTKYEIKMLELELKLKIEIYNELF
jgi:hypothetical protein